MKPADKETIAHLNAVLKNKLTGINQYFLHARLLKHQGNVALADYEYRVSIGAMKHSDMLVEHILALGGMPNLQELGQLAIGTGAEECLRGDLAMAEASLVEIRAGLGYCETVKDAATAALFNKILASHQEHIDFIHTELATLAIKDCA